MPASGSISEDLRDFLRLCLHKDPLRRAHAEELLSHPFVMQVLSTPRLIDSFTSVVYFAYPLSWQQGHVKKP